MHLNEVRNARVEGARHVVGVRQHLYLTQQLHRAHASAVQRLTVEVFLHGEKMAQDSPEEWQVSHADSKPAHMAGFIPAAVSTMNTSGTTMLPSGPLPAGYGCNLSIVIEQE